MLNRLNEVNSFDVKPVDDPGFRKYGKVLTKYDFSGLLEYLEQKTAIPQEGNCYVASEPEMEKEAVYELLKKNFYADMPLEIGYCNGKNSKLNALEYHKGSEIDVAGTDLVLLLAPLEAIEDNRLDTKLVEAFYVKAGTALELYATTLHFSPCKLSDNGFKCVIILPDQTNTPLEQIPEMVEEEDRLLWMRNKWLIAHAESVPASKGAHVGLVGENLEVRY